MSARVTRDQAAISQLYHDTRDLAQGRLDFRAVGPGGLPIRVSWFRVPGRSLIKYRLEALGRVVECSDPDLLMATFVSLKTNWALPPMPAVPRLRCNT